MQRANMWGFPLCIMCIHQSESYHHTTVLVHVKLSVWDGKIWGIIYFWRKHTNDTYLDESSAYLHALHFDLHCYSDCYLSMSCASSFQPPHVKSWRKRRPSREGEHRRTPLSHRFGTCGENKQKKMRQLRVNREKLSAHTLY